MHLWRGRVNDLTDFIIAEVGLYKPPDIDFTVPAIEYPRAEPAVCRTPAVAKG